MPLSADEREYVIATAADILRHRQRERLIEILAERIDRGDYPEGAERERDLDRIAHAIARAIDEGLQT